MIRFLSASLTVLAAATVLSAQQQTASPPATQQPAQPGQARTFTPEEMAAYRAALPDGAARDLVIRVCGQCHEPNRAAALRLTRDGWEGVMEKMKGLGAQANDQEAAQITDYLSENFKGEAPKPINMNTATSVEQIGRAHV